MPTQSQRVLAALTEESVAAPAPVMRRWTPVVIVASPRPLTGKTFAARLFADFLRVDGAPVKAFDLNPDEDSLADFLPDVAVKADIETTESQMALFDRLVADDGVAKVVDLGHALFAKFFALVEQIGFVEEAGRHPIELVI